jgi:hypothetical protein
MRYDGHEVIDGELVDAPRVLAGEPARPVDIVCATHPAWLACELALPTCVQHAVPAVEPDTRTWTERATTFRVVDRRRPR